MKLKFGYFALFFIALSAAGTTFAQTGKTVGPLLQTKWGMSDVYETMLPEKSRFGCVGVAVAQIMRYHKHPVKGSGQSDPYTTSYKVNVPSVNFSNISFDWSNTLDTYPDINSGTDLQRKTIAEIYKNIAIGIQMNFGFNGTGGGVNGGPLVKGLTSFFGYDKSIQTLYRSYYTDNAWEAIIRSQLDAGLPVYYSGRNQANTSDHVFIIDGYDSSGKFHINWGWNGQYDGWYSLNALNPGRSYDFNFGQIIRINVKPDKGGKGSNEAALADFNTEKKSVPQNELFTVTAQIRSLGFFSGGHVGAALVDKNNKIIEIIGMNGRASSGFNALEPGVARTAAISCFIPDTVKPGQYLLKIVIKPEGGDWKLVELSEINDGVPNAVDLTVTPYTGKVPGGGCGLSLETFSVVDDKVSASYGETFSVSVKIRKIGQNSFLGGRLGVALVDNNGGITAIVRELNWNLLNPGAGYRSQTISNCKVPETAARGRYQLKIVVKTEDSAEWKLATLSLPGIPTSIDFTVK